MAEGAIRKSNAGVAVSITGFAGEAGPGDEPGLVYFAAKRRGYAVSDREEHFGQIGRSAVREAAARISLEMLMDELSCLEK